MTLTKQNLLPATRESHNYPSPAPEIKPKPAIAAPEIKPKPAIVHDNFKCF
jgi:hypothetical protein